MEEVLIRVNNLCKNFKKDNTLFAKEKIEILKNIDLTIYKNEMLGLIGESGSGKTTLGKILVGLETPTSGSIEFNGEKLDFASTSSRKYRQEFQMIFQDIYNSFNPLMTIREILQEPIVNEKRKIQQQKINQVLQKVGLSQELLDRNPEHLSGGQRQRVGIARVLLSNPSFIVSDEIVSALDVSIKAQILNLLKDIQKESGVTNLFISHDLGVVRYVCDRVAIMKDGEIIEINTCEEIFKNPKTDYTKLLIDSVPRLWQ